MKTLTLVNFQYYNAATTYCVRATEYTLHSGKVEWRLTVVDGEHAHTCAPLSRSAAMQAAEYQIAEFIGRMRAIYDPEPN